MAKDWTGSEDSIFKTLGASNHTKEDREENDYYATEPKAVELLLAEEKFSKNILEPMCGEGHISKILEAHGYNVTSFDIIDRKYGSVQDFFSYDKQNEDIDIITNPAYKFALEAVKKALDVVANGHKVAMFLKLSFLEGKARKPFFLENPPKVIYVSSSRLVCAKNGKFKGQGSAVAYAWFVWIKGFKGDPIIKWIN